MTVTRTGLFVGAVALQLAIVLYSPAKVALVRILGREISLEMAPVDPYEVTLGYSMSISYAIGRPDRFQSAPRLENGRTYYALLQVGPDHVGRPKALLTHFPANLAPGEVVIKGRYRNTGRFFSWGMGLEYGIESLYIPETMREEIAAAVSEQFRAARSSNQGTIAVPAERMCADVRIDRNGNASLLRLHVGDRVYE